MILKNWSHGDSEELEPYKVRGLAEKQSLDQKARKLSDFIAHSDMFTALNGDEQELLREQNDVMWRYSELLGKRIETMLS